MGSGVSRNFAPSLEGVGTTVETEINKPLDGSDISDGDFDKAKSELIRLRSVMKEQYDICKDVLSKQMPAPQANGTGPPPAADLWIGMDVEARYKQYPKFYKAVITGMKKKDSADLQSAMLYDLRYEDNEIELGVERIKIRLPNETQPAKLETGMLVDAACTASKGVVNRGKIKRGSIRASKGGMTYTVEFEDGEVVENLERKYIFAMHTAADAAGGVAGSAGGGAAAPAPVEEEKEEAPPSGGGDAAAKEKDAK